MKLTRVLPLLAITAACTLGAVPAASAATDVPQASSANWSGYVVGSSSSSSARTFKSVAGSWVAPTAKCTGSNTYSAFWVGLGGAGQTEALEQAGTEANCTATGQASYYAWYELVPSAPVRVNLAVRAGDHIATRVTVNGTNVAISVADQTTGDTFSKDVTMSDPDTSSAEWIAEAPSACNTTAGAVTGASCSPLPLTNFGTVSFSSASATTADGHTGTISDSAFATDAVALNPSASTSGFQGASYNTDESSGAAQPSSLSSDGSSFSVVYSSQGPSAASSTGTGQGYGGPGSGGSGSGGYGYGSGGYGYGSGGYGYGGYGGADYGSGGYGGYGGYGGSGYGYGGESYGYSDGSSYGYDGYTYAPASRPDR